MIPVEWIEPLVQELADETLARGKTAVQNIAVEEVFDKSPGRAAREQEGDCDPGMRCRKCDRQHENRVQGVEGRQRVEATSCKGGLLPLVCREGNFRGPLLWRRTECGFCHCASQPLVAFLSRAI